MHKLLNQLKTKSFTYSGSDFTEKEVIKKGHLHLQGNELLSEINNKTIYGDYPMGYKFVANIYENGKVEGVNNVGSFDYGSWKINEETNTLQLEWRNGWIDTLTRAYKINGNIEFFDIESGNWRTTFKMIENLN